MAAGVRGIGIIVQGIYILILLAGVLEDDPQKLMLRFKRLFPNKTSKVL